jgi:DNA-binding NarL/FixJ family response regulator
MPIRVSVVDDDDLVRESLCTLINGADGFVCVAAYNSAESAIAGMTDHPADVTLMDINLPAMSGIECVAELKTVHTEMEIIMLTMFEDDDNVFDSLRAGASGYLLKRTTHAQILAAIQDVHHGGSPMSSSVARKVVHMVEQTSPRKSGEAEGLGDLSPRELEILEHLAGGYRYKEIADTLSISIETVRTHLRRLYKKLQVTSRTEAAVKFLQR